jgi:acylphosphatase
MTNETMSALEIRHIFIEGRVQGVGYRDFVCRHAQRLGIKGWVRNRADGSVEAHVVGALADVEALFAELRKGPPQSRVVNLRFGDYDPKEARAVDGFTVRQTL